MYTCNLLCRNIGRTVSDFRIVMIIWLEISLYRQFQCSGSRFLNQVTFFEEDEEEIVVVDVIVPHSRCSWNFACKVMRLNCLYMWKRRKVENEEGWKLIEDSSSQNLNPKLLLCLICMTSLSCQIWSNYRLTPYCTMIYFKLDIIRN